MRDKKNGENLDKSDEERDKSDEARDKSTNTTVTRQSRVSHTATRVSCAFSHAYNVINVADEVLTYVSYITSVCSRFI